MIQCPECGKLCDTSELVSNAHEGTRERFMNGTLCPRCGCEVDEFLDAVEDVDFDEEMEAEEYDEVL